MWGKLGEIAAQYLRKASKVYIEGRLQTRDWAGQDGVKRYRTEIIAENMIMLDAKGMDTSGSSNFGSAGSSTMNSAPAYDEQPQEVIEEEIKVEDIPF